MAGPKDVILGQFQFGQMLFDKFTGDLSDADYFRLPMPGTNHVAWVMGHIACTEDWASGLVTGNKQRIPATTHELFNGSSKAVADASLYPSRKDLDELFKGARANTVEVLAAFDETRWDEPSPEGAPKDMIPTLGSLWNLLGVHQFWHIGHITVCRVALGKKPVLTGG